MRKRLIVSVRPRLVATLALLATCLAPSAASAFERQFHLGGGIGYVGLKRGDYSGASIGGEIDLTYGLNDMFNLMVEGSLTQSGLTKDVPSPDGNGTVAVSLNNDKFWMATADVGISYTLDVLQWVPYAGLLVGGARLSGGPTYFNSLAGKDGAETRLDGVIAAGIDYQLNRALALGLAARVHLLINPGDTTDLLQIYLRAAYTWGY